MKIEEVRNFRNIEAFWNKDCINPMTRSEIAEAFCYVIKEIQNEIAECSCKYSMNKNPEEYRIALERIATLVGDYRFKTETGIIDRSNQ